MRNVIIKTDEPFGYGIYNNLDDLTINLVGDNIVESEYWDGICSCGSLTLMGGGSLSVKGQKCLDFLGYEKQTLIISDGVNLCFDGFTYGVCGSGLLGHDGITYYTDVKVRGRNTVVRARGQYGSFSSFNSLTLSDGLSICQPEGAVFENNTVCVGGYQVSNEFVEISAGGGAKRGDVNRDGRVDISDVVAVINTMAGDNKFKATSDVNGDNRTDISDVVAIINIMAGGGN